MRMNYHGFYVFKSCRLCVGSHFAGGGRNKDKTIYSNLSVITKFIGSIPIILFFIFSLTFAGEIQRRSFPLPVRIDHQYYIRSSMLVNCDVKMYGAGFKDFSTIYDEPSESKFKQLVLAIRQGDLGKCLTLSKHGPDVMGEVREISQVAVQGYGRMLDAAVMGKNFEKMRVTERFHVGQDVIFIWGLDSPSLLKGGPLRRGFRFVKNYSGDVLWSSEPPDTVMSVLTSVAQQRAEYPANYVSSEPVQLQYSCSLTKETGGHDVLLCFNGIPCDVNVFDSNESSNDIISFYQRAYRTFRDRPVSEFAELYTEKSRDKFLDWYSKLDPNIVIAYRNSIISNERKIFFVINGDPVFIIFYCHPDGDDSIGVLNRVRYEYVVRDKGRLKLTNFYYEGFLDALLEDRALFIKPVLGPVIPKKPDVSP